MATIVRDNNRYITAGQLQPTDSQGRTNFFSLDNGWLQMNVDNFTFTAANKLIVTGYDLSNSFEVGDKLQIIQGTTKYFYIIGKDSEGIFITGGNNYTFTNTAITEIYYSKYDNPANFPNVLGHTATHVEVGGMTGVIGFQDCNFAIRGRLVQLQLFTSSWTLGGVANSNLALSLPVKADTTKLYYHSLTVKDNSTYQGGYGLIQVTSDSIFMSKYNGSNFTLGLNLAGCIANITYKIADTI